MYEGVHIQIWSGILHLESILEILTLEAMTLTETKAREVTWLDTQLLTSYLHDNTSGTCPLQFSPSYFQSFDNPVQRETWLILK